MRARTLVVAKTGSEVWRASAELDDEGYPTITAETHASAIIAAKDLRIDAVVIDASLPELDPSVLCASIRSQCAPRLVPVLVIGPRDRVSHLDLGSVTSALVTPAHPKQLLNRVKTLLRTTIIEREIKLRAETFQERGVKLTLPGKEIYNAPFRILFCGEASPAFMGLSAALSSAGVEVTAAFTAYTAFDYLHEHDFDAVVLGASDSPKQAYGVVSGMRRNSRHFHVPALLLAEAGFEDTSEAFERDFDDIISAKSPLEDMRARVLELARDCRHKAALKTAFEGTKTSGLMDAGTGLFTKEVFATHLLLLVKSARTNEQPLSLVTMRLVETPAVTRARASGALDRALPQIGQMMGRLLRTEDTAGRLSFDVFAMALPSTPLLPARLAADRVTSVIDCTAFENAQDEPFQVAFHIGVAELLPSETAEKFLARTVANMGRRAAV